MKPEKKLIYFLVFVIFFMLLVRIYGPRYLMQHAPRKTGPLPVAAMSDLPAPDGRPMFIMFYSVNCSICEALKPEIKKLHGKYGDRVRFQMIDTDNPAMARVTSDFNVEGLPTFFWLTADRKVFDTKVGGWPAREIRRSTEELAATAAEAAHLKR